MPTLRLARLLSQQLSRFGSYQRLAKEISQANDGTVTIDRRKLASIVSGEAKSLKISDLEAIDNFLRRFGPGLSELPLFESKGMLRAITQCRNIACLIPAQVDRGEQRKSLVSTWDIRTASELVKMINEMSANCQLRIESIPHRPCRDAMPDVELFSQLLEDKETAYLCIGSPYSTDLASFMLADMLGVPSPFAKPPRVTTVAVPFYFVWPLDGMTSRFALTPDETEASGIRLPEDGDVDAIRSGNARALIIGNDAYVWRKNRTTCSDYAVIVAQSRPNGGAWVVIAGLSGIGTYAAATLVPDIECSLPQSSGTERAPAVYAVVEAPIETNSNVASGDPRTLRAEPQFIVAPRTWSAAY